MSSVLRLLAGCSLVVAGFLAFSWVDDGDSTCGALYRPAHWTDSPICRQVMGARLVAVLALVATATLLVGVDRLRRGRAGRAVA